MNRRDRLVISTPEGVHFAYPLASPVSRCLAFLVDLSVIGAANGAIGTGVEALRELFGEWTMAIAIILSFLVYFGYHIALEWFWHGQTLGKRLLRLRVIDRYGLRLQFNQVLVRNLLRFIDAQPLLFYGFGGVTALLSRDGQRLGDIAAATVVVRDDELAAPDFSGMLTDKFNSLRAYPHLAARLRQRLDPLFPRLLLDALRRRDELDAEARITLYANFAAALRALAAFPPEAVDGLSDEQYLRNCLDLIVRPTG